MLINPYPISRVPGSIPRIIFGGFCKQHSIFTGLIRFGKNIKFFLNYFFGPLIFLWLAYSLYKQILRQPNLEQTWLNIKDSLSGPLVLNLVAVMLLMIVNWSIEAIKWKLSVRQVQPVSFNKAFRAILSGVSFSIITPNRTGEYLGRVLYMEEGNRLRVISLTVLSSLSQLIVTIFYGMIGLYILGKEIRETDLFEWSGWMEILFYTGLSVWVALTVFYFRLKWLLNWSDKLKLVRKYAWLINELGKINATLLLQMLSLSVARYIVFAVQYFLLFRFFGMDLNWFQVFWGMSVMFFIMAFIPTIAIFEVVKRAVVATAVFKAFTANLVGISFVTTTVWFINLVVPAVTGSLLILRIKIFRSKNEGV